MNKAQRIDELEAALRAIRNFAAERCDLTWEDHGDDFRKIRAIADEALADVEPTPQSGATREEK